MARYTTNKTMTAEDRKNFKLSIYDTTDYVNFTGENGINNNFENIAAAIAAIQSDLNDNTNFESSKYNTQLSDNTSNISQLSEKLNLLNDTISSIQKQIANSGYAVLG